MIFPNLVSTVEITVSIGPHRRRAVVSTAVPEEKPTIVAAANIPNIFALSITDVFPVFTQRFAAVFTPANISPVLAACLTHVLPVFPCDPAVLGVHSVRGNKDQTKRKRNNSKF